MERENSYFLTEGVTDKPASVKMDLEICELYYKVIEKLLSNGDYKNNIKIIRRFLLLFSPSNNTQSEKQNSLEKIIVSKKELRKLKQTLFYRILYIYWNGVCFASAVACHFRKFLACSPCVLKELMSKKSIRICSLGGGCLPDVIAIVKVLESMADANEYMDIRVSVVDIDKKWMITCIAILQTLEHFRNATWEIDFTHADFTKPLSSLVIDMIKNADIVSMVMLLPQVKGLKKQRRILPKVQKLMQPGSVLFFMNHSIPSLVTTHDFNLDDMSEYNLLYKTTSDLHTLDEAVLERVFSLYYDKFHLSQFCTHITVTTRVWQRPSDMDARKIAYLKLQKEKLTEMENNLAKNKTLLREMTKEIQLLQKLKIESIKSWEIFFNNERKKGWTKKKQIRKIVRPEADFIDAELEKIRSLIPTLNKDIMIEEQELKKLQTYLAANEKDYTVASGKEEKKERNRYKKYVKKLMKHLKQNYSIYSTHKENEEFDRDLLISGTIFTCR